VAAARFRGLPTQFLENISEHYSIWEGNAHTKPMVNVIVLPPDSLSAWREISMDRTANGLHNFYHETTHAFLDLKSDDPKFAKFINDGERYYEGAILENGERASDPHRLFQEAAAQYVQHRVALFYRTLSILRVLACVQEVMPARIPEDLAKITREYVDGANQPIFAYERPFLGEQEHTTRDISPEIKSFLDQELLEGKIPPDFDAVENFRLLEKEALDRVPR
jgi:hypothetical protein